MLANVTTDLKNLPGLIGISIFEVAKSQSERGDTG